MQSFLLVKVCVIVFALTFARFAATQNVNDDCAMAGTGAAGTCVLLQNCASALEDIAKNSLYPTNCGYQNGEQIVCCRKSPTAKPSPAPATRISEKSKQKNSRLALAFPHSVHACQSTIFSIQNASNTKHPYMNVFRCPLDWVWIPSRRKFFVAPSRMCRSLLAAKVCSFISHISWIIFHPQEKKNVLCSCQGERIPAHGKCTQHTYPQAQCFVYLILNGVLSMCFICIGIDRLWRRKYGRNEMVVWWLSNKRAIRVDSSSLCVHQTGVSSSTFSLFASDHKNESPISKYLLFIVSP